MAAINANNTASIGFEQQIWAAADVLRGNMDAAEYKHVVLVYTPSCVVRTLVEVLQPFLGRVYDPCCGSGGMFVQSTDFVKNHSGNIGNVRGRNTAEIGGDWI